MTPEETIDHIVEKMDGISGQDPDADHGYADNLLLEALRVAGRGDVADAYERLVERARWWATA